MAADSSITKAWIDSVVGRNWEIFWGSADPEISSEQPNGHAETANGDSNSADKPSKKRRVESKNGNNSEEEAEEEEDWYAGHVKKFLKYEGGPRKPDKQRPIFQVLFVGDDELYEMCVTPGILRPCSRTWVKRSLALLGAQKISMRAPLHNQMPTDTRLLQDEEDLTNEKDKVETEFGVIRPLSRVVKERSLKGNLPELNQLKRVRDMLCLIRQQICLRSRLVPTDDGSTNDGEDESPSLSYIEFLVECLKVAAQCCEWYERCYAHLYKMFDTTEEQNLPRDDVLKLFVEDGKETLSGLVGLDPSSTGFKRKRKITTAQGVASPSPTRRTKRRRKTNGIVEFLVEEESGERFVNASTDDFLSTAFVRELVDRLAQDDERWFALAIGRMLLSLSVNVVLPLLNWERRSEFYLGEREELKLEASNGSSSDEDSDNASESSPSKSSRWITYEDIESVIEASTTDRVLSNVDFSKTTSRLTAKLGEITSFEERCWAAIDERHSEDGSPHDPADDETLKKIHVLIDTAKRKDSPVGNVEPFGKESSPLTRKVLQNAATNRIWFLDLKHAELVRERALFVDEVVSRYKKLPTLPAKGTSAAEESDEVQDESDSIDNRVKELASLLSENVALFDQHKKSLGKREGGTPDESNLNSALEELQSVRAISVAEEMVLCRRDIISWLEQAKLILVQSMPRLSDIEGIKVGLDRLLTAQCPRREKVSSSLRSSVETDAELRQFVQADLDFYCQDAMKRTMWLHSTGTAWKERCDAILAALRYHGNVAVGGQDNSQVLKNSGMVDLKRIEDLLQEYPCLEVVVEDEFKCLSAAYQECDRWSEAITNQLLGERPSFSDALSAAEAANQGRPRGVILQPTRQILDVVVDLLRWYSSVKALVTGRYANMAAAYQLLVEGTEIVELHGKSRNRSDQFALTSDSADLLRRKLDSRKPVRCFTRAKLESHSITQKFLVAMVDETRDQSEGLPLFSLLLLSWRLHAENFAARFVGGEGADSDFSLEQASKLKAAMPSLSDQETDFFSEPDAGMSQFTRLIDEAEGKRVLITETLSASKVVLRDCLRNPEKVRLHTGALKDFIAELKRCATQRTMLSLPRSFDLQLEKEIKLFAWLSRAVQYSGAFKDDEGPDDPPLAAGGRVPWDVLVKLNESRPEMVEGNGDFTLVLLRVKELYEAANIWQEEVSNQTLLSLRGGKRRSTFGGENGADADDGQQMIDLAKVAEMSASPILKKVAMPREQAIRSMLENTKKFDELLQDFLGKDYSGHYPDRIQLPSGNSLADDDGRFILLRLTGSPLFLELKAALNKIAVVADDVLAETPGKATFDWICKAVQWIESLSSCIDRDNMGYGQLSVQKHEVMELLRFADAVLLDVPEDLRKTLSQYGIFVSTNREGRLTVKSKKGAAHHSIGTTAIRWSPVLFEALKEDIGRLEAWESKMVGMCHQCAQFAQSLMLGATRQHVLHGHHLREELGDLLGEASELVVIPPKELFDIGSKHAFDLTTFLSSISTPDIDQEFAEAVLNHSAAVTRDRGIFLDALVDRGIAAQRVKEPAVNENTKNDLPFRAAAMSLISRGLEQGITSIASDMDDDGDSLGLCKLKASEIEDSLFRYLQTKSEDKITPRYREKVRLLKRAFSDMSNSTLVLQVVCGDIDPDKLVRMSSDQLANPQIRRDREKAEARAKEKTILTRSLAKTQQEENEAKTEEEKPEESEEGDSEETFPSSNGPEPQQKQAQSHESSPSLKKAMKPTTRSAGPPPPPPSLATSLRSQSAAAAASSVPHISNASGSDQFTLTIAKMIFSAYFIPTASLRPNAESMLPESLHDSHRTRVDEFIDFLVGKRNSGNWDIYTLRLQPCSDGDAREYKKFYKDFESKQRIVMFKLPMKNKLFLITPRFHREVRDLIRMENSSSTYAVLLLRN